MLSTALCALTGTLLIIFANETNTLAVLVIFMTTKLLKIDLNKKVPFDQAYWVVPDRLMAGCYPGSVHRQDAHPKLSALLECGIRHFISLMGDDEIIWHGKPPVPYEAQVRALSKGLAKDKPVYLHCLGGVGRTGTVVGCYLARHGYASGHKIFRLIQHLRQNAATHERSSPETGNQVDLVRSWVQGE